MSLFFLGGESNAQEIKDNDTNLYGFNCQLDIKREIYEDNINSLSIGLCNQYGQLEISQNYLDISPDTTFALLSKQKLYGHGLSVSNRFNSKFKKLNLFVEVDLRTLIHWTNDVRTRINLSYSHSPTITTSQTLNIRSGFKFRNPAIYFGLEPGIEFKLQDNLFMFFSTSFRKTLNNVNKEIEFSPFIPNFQPSKLNYLSLNFGLRF